jgi:Saccharopine dehydrogenase NADP binding domain
MYGRQGERTLSKTDRNGVNPQVAVFGAAGHTGRFVVAELLRRRMAPIAIARDVASFNSSGWSPHDVFRREASVEEPKTLDLAFNGVQAVINCAGPFLETADEVANAALRAKAHYLDVSAEQPSARDMLDMFDVAAREAGVAVIPSMSFYGGFADLLVTAAIDDWGHAETIDVMIGLDSWHPTRGTRITGEKNTSQRMVVAGGALVPLSLPRTEKEWTFDGPLGHQFLVEVPFSEIVLITRHVKMAELHTWLNRIALDDIHSSTTPTPKPADETGLSSQRFIVEVVATRDGSTRRIIAQGRDIYAFSAILVCEAVERLFEDKFSGAGAGAQSAGMIFEAREFLSALTPDHLAFEIRADLGVIKSHAPRPMVLPHSSTLRAGISHLGTKRPLQGPYGTEVSRKLRRVIGGEAVLVTEK